MVAALLPYPRSPLPGLPRPLTVNAQAQWYALLGTALTVIGGLVVGLWTQIYQARAKRDEIGAETKKNEMAELRELRQELREDTDRLRVRLEKVEAQLGEANSAILRQTGMISHIGVRLEALILLQDIESVRAEGRALIADIQRFADTMPIGVFERHNLIGEKKENEQ